MDQETKTSPTSVMTETDTASAAKTPTSTLYPKIGRLKDFLHNFNWTLPSNRMVPLIGSVKLHGAHADWVISSDDTIRVQSHNVLDVSLTKDPYELFAFTTPIRPGVAISQLSWHFVVISIYVNDGWVPESQYADLNAEAHGIYNIGMTEFYRLDLNLDNSDHSEATNQALVIDVERYCPYGLMRGVTGIVWKPLDYASRPELWFKYRGDSTAVSHSWKLPATGFAVANPQREETFATAVVTAQRMEQGWEYLKETDVPRNEAGVGKFLAWITNDIFTEENQEMKEKNISKGKLKPAIKAIAAPWYKKRLTEFIREDTAHD
ncbi:MAG: hypothetical protein Q9212_000392 [Teloschistes hypoglaucus]